MQAWQQVKVINEASGHYGQAGVVVRVEKASESAIVYVRLDTTEAVESFHDTELVLL